ncbi:MAG TPA: hypothetical protein VFT99_05155, partial [Roseiflexaceae bacterium]|nr:hypothetical protein [Roseiflexaceae bacterium]
VDRMRTVDPEIGEYDEIAAASRQKLLEQEQAERVAALYNDGLNLMRDGHWAQALECFEEIERRTPGYQQTPALLQRVREELGTPAAVVSVEAPTPQETRAMSRRARLAAQYFGSILFSIVLDIGLGHAMWSLGRVPLYLDTLGSIIVGLVFGPWVGLVSGLAAHFIWPLLGLESGTFAGSLAYLVGLVGLIAGFVGRSGLLSRRLPPWLAALVGAVTAVGLGYCTGVAINGPYGVSNTFRQYPWLTDELVMLMPLVIGVATIGAVLGWWRRPQVFTAGLIGLATGVITALCSIPIAAHVFYGASSEWADVLNGSWIGNIPSTAAIVLPAGLFGDGGISDPLDKLFSFMLAYYVVRAIPERWLARLGVTSFSRHA